MPSGKPVRIVVVMGVAECGKTSVGSALGDREGAPFLDGDDYHPAANVAKMSAGTPLTDDDRWPWLEALARALAEVAEANGRVFAACSALKRAYRERLTVAAGEPVLFVHLAGGRDLIGARIGARRGHYMPSALLDSQFAVLEPPQADEFAVSVAIDGTVDEIVAAAAREIEAAGRS